MLPNLRRGFLANAFFGDTKEIKAKVLIRYLYSLFLYTIQDHTYRVALETTLHPYKYHINKETLDKIKLIAEVVDLDDPSQIDFTSDLVKKGLDQMHNGAIYEASNLYQNNYECLNLPPTLECLFLDQNIRLQNVSHLITKKFTQSGNDIFSNTQKLTEGLQNLVNTNKTLEVFFDVCMKHSQTENNSPDSNPVKILQERLEVLIYEPLDTIDWNQKHNAFSREYGPLSSFEVTLSADEAHQKAANFFEKYSNWINDLKKNAKPLSGFIKVLNQLDEKVIKYDEFVELAAHVLYNENALFLLGQTNPINLFGLPEQPEKESDQ